MTLLRRWIGGTPYGGERRLVRKAVGHGVTCELADLARVAALAELRQRDAK